MKALKHISYSSIELYLNCPRAWHYKYVLEKTPPPGDAANFGSNFDRAVAHLLGLGKIEGEMDGAVRRAAEWYLQQPAAWNKADGAQVEVEISPSQWAALSDGAPDLPWPLIGYIDMERKMDEVRRETCDLKTSLANNNPQFRPMWALQGTLYCLIRRAHCWHVHLFSTTRALEWRPRLTTWSYWPNGKTYAWAMNLVGRTAQRMKSALDEANEAMEAIPDQRRCEWCAGATAGCEASVVGRL